METQETETTEQKDSRNFAAMRTRAEQAEAKAQSLEKIVKDQAVQIAGFDPKDPMVGLVAEKWTPGDGELTADSFKAHAESFNLKPVTSAAGEAATTETQAEQQLETLQSAGDQLRTASTQQTPEPDVKAKIAAAEAAGDWNTAGSLKTQLMLEKSGIKI